MYHIRSFLLRFPLFLPSLRPIILHSFPLLIPPTLPSPLPRLSHAPPFAPSPSLPLPSVRPFHCSALPRHVLSLGPAPTFAIASAFLTQLLLTASTEAEGAEMSSLVARWR